MPQRMVRSRSSSQPLQLGCYTVFLYTQLESRTSDRRKMQYFESPRLQQNSPIAVPKALSADPPSSVRPDQVEILTTEKALPSSSPLRSHDVHHIAGPSPHGLVRWIAHLGLLHGVDDLGLGESRCLHACRPPVNVNLGQLSSCPGSGFIGEGQLRNSTLQM